MTVSKNQPITVYNFQRTRGSLYTYRRIAYMYTMNRDENTRHSVGRL
jgi:hypothetical protein